jgi:hypothetical protein
MGRSAQVGRFGVQFCNDIAQNAAFFMNIDHKTAESEDICKGRVFFRLVTFVPPNNFLAEGKSNLCLRPQRCNA